MPCKKIISIRTFDLMSIKCIMSKSIYIRLYYVATHQFDMYTHITHRMFPYKCPDQPKRQLQQQQTTQIEEDGKKKILYVRSSLHVNVAPKPDTHYTFYVCIDVYDLKLANATSIVTSCVPCLAFTFRCILQQCK